MKEPFFAWLHLFPPHDPYLPPRPFKGMFNESTKMRSYKEQEHLIEESYQYLFKRQRFPDEMRSAVNQMKDYYDEFVTYIDNEFKRFIQELDKRDFENTIIILTSDHGESFEHGYFTHGGPYLYEQVTHIPLIIREPGQQQGKIIKETVEQTDIAPTILNLAGVSVPSWIDGRSLLHEG
jgi:arylsulfatase A-like enzyme